MKMVWIASTELVCWSLSFLAIKKEFIEVARLSLTGVDRDGRVTVAYVTPFEVNFGGLLLDGAGSDGTSVVVMISMSMLSESGSGSRASVLGLGWTSVLGLGWTWVVRVAGGGGDSDA